MLGDVQVPILGPGQVLVRIAYSGICGKQIDEITGKRGPDRYIPHLLGHEGAGIVEEIGPGVKKVEPGDHVVLHWMKGPGIDSAPPTFALDGRAINAGWITTFSERSVISENRMTPIDHEFPLDLAATLGCAVTTGLGIAFHDASLSPGASLLVLGAGGIGLNVLQGAALVNAHPVVAVDIHPSKLELATVFGATHTLIADRDLRSRLRAVIGDRGFDVAVDTTGLPQIIETAYDLTSGAGRVILAGVPDHRHRITIDSFPLHFGRRIFGSHGGGTRPDRDIPLYIDLCRQGKLKLEDLVTHRYSLDRINEAIADVRAGGVGRCLISTEAAHEPVRP